MAGPTEAVAVFHDVGDLTAAIDELLSAGFDRAHLSLMAAHRTVEQKLGHAFTNVAEIEDDAEVPRIAYISSEAIGDAEGGLVGGMMYIGGVAAAGAVLASGGTLASAVLGTVLAGGGGGAIGALLARVIDRHHAHYLQDQLDRGGILLWVRTPDEAHEARARTILSKHAGDDVHLHELPAAAG
jgi:hypothetical protein